jgi:opacity protein-like surface antigen
MASSNFTGKAAVISDLRVGTHPDKTRIVLDVSHPTDLSYKVSRDGKTIRLDLPNAAWSSKNSRTGFGGGSIVGFTYSVTSKGSRLTLKSDTAVRIKRPFFVSPGGNRGHRIVIDIVPAPIRMAKRAGTTLVASLNNIGALPKRKVTKPRIEIAQVTGSNNPYIRRAFPQNNKKRSQPAPRKVMPQPTRTTQPPYQTPGQTLPVQTRNKFLGLPNAYARGSLGLHMISETSSEGGDNDYDSEFSPGFLISGAIGTTLDNGFRVEGEFFYANSTLKQVSGNALGTIYNTEEVSGDISTIAFMGNLIYDFPNNSRLVPYAMGGVGFAGLFINDFKAGNTSIADDMDWVFALQLGTGVSFALDNRTKIEIGYRYFETQDPEFSDATGTPFESIYASHSFLIGARVDLN